ncbi:histidinol-phosphatase HisJ [Alkalibacterium sp. f15]|uniref:histidinol-phosphatase HisJ n=1 Tax=Alkalibacterium sp. f15 TaxID=3414029 RepID=UPI003BF81F7E
MLSDNHVHTQYCPHGSAYDMEEYIKTAIAKGLGSITFTEHAPLPIEDTTPAKDSSMREEDVERYLDQGKRLKAKYAKDIVVNIGFEIDYIEGKEAETLVFLKKHSETIPYSIISVHFLKIPDHGYFCIDYDKDVFLEKINQIGYDRLTRLYEETLLKAVTLPFGKWTPKTIGHITLIYKFSDAHDKEDEIDWDRLLKKIRTNDYILDYNFSGIDKPFYKRTYPFDSLVESALNEGIKLAYGSDAHHPDDVGRYFERGINHG